MHYTRGTKVSTLALSDTQTTSHRKRTSLMEASFTTVKSKFSTFGIPSSKTIKRGTEERELKRASYISKRKSFDVNLPPRQVPAALQAPAREFPSNWQTSLGPTHSTLRRNTPQVQSAKGSKTCSRSSQIWPTTLGSRSKFVRLIVVASPSLQRLSHRG